MSLGELLSKVETGINDKPDMEILSELYKIAESNPNKKLSKANRAVLHAQYGSILAHQGNQIASLIELEKASFNNPRNPEIAIRKAAALFQNKQPSEALDTLNRIPNDVRITPDQIERVVKLRRAIKKGQYSKISSSKIPD